jgi:3-methyladenine DNA glycosylase AlkD
VDRDEVLAWLERHGRRRVAKGMARYAVVARRVFGVQMGTLQALAKQLGTDHDLAVELWQSGWYEARQSATSTRELASPAVRANPARRART